METGPRKDDARGTGANATFSGLRLLEVEHLADRAVCADYVAEVTAARQRVNRLEAALRRCAETSAQVAVFGHCRRSAQLQPARAVRWHARCQYRVTRRHSQPFAGSAFLGKLI